MISKLDKKYEEIEYIIEPTARQRLHSYIIQDSILQSSFDGHKI